MYKVWKFANTEVWAASRGGSWQCRGSWVEAALGTHGCQKGVSPGACSATPPGSKQAWGTAASPLLGPGGPGVESGPGPATARGELGADPRCKKKVHPIVQWSLYEL